MPSTSKKQHNFMAAIAHSPSFAKKVGVSQSVGKDFTAADKGRKFRTGGRPAINKQNTQHGSMDMPFKSLKRFGGMKSGGKVKKYEEGGDVPDTYKSASEAGAMPMEDKPKSFKEAFAAARSDDAKTFEWNGKKYTTEMASEKGSPNMGRSAGVTKSRTTGGAPNVFERTQKMARGFKAGGNVKYNFEKSGKDVEKKGMKEGSKAEMALDKKQMPMKSGKPAFMMKKGGTAKYAKGGGIESRGKTKGTVIRMASGGSVSSASRRADGIAQRGKTRC